MNLAYKKANEKDLAVIAQLAERIWRAHYITIISGEQIDYMLQKMYSPKSLAEQMKNGHAFTLIYRDAVPVGYISLSTQDRSDYFLHKFYVESNEQARGIGTKVLKHICEELGTFKSIELTVNRKNYKAINFYFKNGFVIKEVADFDIGDGYFMNDFVMVKKGE